MAQVIYVAFLGDTVDPHTACCHTGCWMGTANLCNGPVRGGGGRWGDEEERGWGWGNLVPWERGWTRIRAFSTMLSRCTILKIRSVNATLAERSIVDDGLRAICAVIPSGVRRPYAVKWKCPTALTAINLTLLFFHLPRKVSSNSFQGGKRWTNKKTDTCCDISGLFPLHLFFFTRISF